MPATFNVSCVTERGPGCTVRNAGGTAGCIHLDNLGGQRRKQSGFGIESSLGSQREAVAARDVERGEATFGREKVESSGTWVRSNLGWSEMASQLLRGGIAVKGIRNKERGEERERERKGREQGRRMGTRGVCRGTERRNADEDRTRYGDERARRTMGFGAGPLEFIILIPIRRTMIQICFLYNKTLL